MNPSLTIRSAQVADIASIRRIADATWPVTYGSSLSPEQLAYMMELMYSVSSLTEQIGKGHQFFIASSAGRDTGFASVSMESNGRCKLNKLYVDPSIQKTGAGKALLEEVVNFSRGQGAETLFLQVKRDNAAKNFYERRGFVVTGELDLDIGNGFFMRDYIMELSL